MWGKGAATGPCLRRVTNEGRGATVDLYRNMIARLELLLPSEDVRHKRSAGSVYRVIVSEDDGSGERDLFEEFLGRSETWDDQRATPQRDEILDLIDRVVDLGTAGLRLREEGLAWALPERRDQSASAPPIIELQEGDTAALRGLPALRLYCTIICGHLVLLGGGVKTTEQVYEASAELREVFNLANALCLQLSALEQQGRLRNGGRTRRLDLSRLGSFPIPLPTQPS